MRRSGWNWGSRNAILSDTRTLNDRLASRSKLGRCVDSGTSGLWSWKTRREGRLDFINLGRLRDSSRWTSHSLGSSVLAQVGYIGRGRSGIDGCLSLRGNWSWKTRRESRFWFMNLARLCDNSRWTSRSLRLSDCLRLCGNTLSLEVLASIRHIGIRASVRTSKSFGVHWVVVNKKVVKINALVKYIWRRIWDCWNYHKMVMFLSDLVNPTLWFSLLRSCL